MSRPATFAFTLALAVSIATGGCKRSGGGAPGQPLATIRLGYFPNVTHATALIAIHHGDFYARLAPATVEPRPFNAGPEEMEALFAGAIDAGYVGPGPALNAWVRSKGGAIVIVAGAGSGGASFVVSKESGITGPESLRGKRLATPQIANTQDVALRSYLRAHGLKSTDLGGDVHVMPMANPDILTLMRGGKLDGAWVPEPWVSRIVGEAGGRILFDERTLWPGGKFPTSLLVVSRRFADDHPEQVRALVAAEVDAVRWGREHPEEAGKLIGDALFELQHQRLPAKVMSDALSRVDLTWDPMPEALAKSAEQARALDYLPAGADVRGAVDSRFLDAVLGGGVHD